ncbi:hypothetical protein TH60_06820 [Pantoea ananatis]|nr:hypothetical protein [Pantoea ananatis]PKC44462.1 hypothetical protein V461_11215 [Pantoea ananatis BRT98]
MLLIQDMMKRSMKGNMAIHLKNYSNYPQGRALFRMLMVERFREVQLLVRELFQSKVPMRG